MILLNEYDHQGIDTLVFANDRDNSDHNDHKQKMIIANNVTVFANLIILLIKMIITILTIAVFVVISQ